MHLSTCPNICEEEYSRYLLDQIMSLRVNRISNGSVLPPTKALLCGDTHANRANPRYSIMVELRRRVWRNVGWESDGKGRDPWARKKVRGEVVRGGDDKVIPDQNLEVKSSHHEEQMPHQNLEANDSTGLEGLDTILASDPMDLFQWDDWESLTSDFFAS